MSSLFVVAHPDDEALGAGATIRKLVEAGEKVTVCVMSRSSPTRHDRSLAKSMAESHRVLGVADIVLGDYRCMGFRDGPHHEMVQFIEGAIKSSKASHIYTHHTADLHHDHYYTSILCQEAARLPHRQICDAPPLKALFFMEVQSSTDWCFNSGMNRFEPNFFVGVEPRHVAKKIEALRQYRNVVRPAPHPRSEETINALATFRGSQCGHMLAESFQCVFMVG